MTDARDRELEGLLGGKREALPTGGPGDKNRHIRAALNAGKRGYKLQARFGVELLPTRFLARRALEWVVRLWDMECGPRRWKDRRDVSYIRNRTSPDLIRVLKHVDLLHESEREKVMQIPEIAACYEAVTDELHRRLVRLSAMEEVRQGRQGCVGTDAEIVAKPRMVPAKREEVKRSRVNARQKRQYQRNKEVVERGRVEILKVWTPEQLEERKRALAAREEEIQRRRAAASRESLERRRAQEQQQRAEQMGISERIDRVADLLGVALALEDDT